MLAESVKIIKRKQKFTQVSNKLLYDPELRARDKGIFCILISFPDDWVFHQSHILTLTKDERASFQSALNSLQKNAYLLILQVRKNGKFDKKIWVLDDEKISATSIEEALVAYDIQLKGDEKIYFTKKTESLSPVVRKTDIGKSACETTVCVQSTATNTHISNTKKTNTYINNMDLSESDNPIQFRKWVLNNFLGQPFCAPGSNLGFAGTTIISISSLGYLHNDVSNKDLTADDAKKVWAWAYDNQDKLLINMESSC